MLSFKLPLTLFLLVAHVSSLGVEPRQSSNSRLSYGWYPGWRSAVFGIDRIPWDKYNHLTFSFGTTTPDPSKISLEESSGDYLPQFVDAAHKHNVKASLAIGGWSGSRYFSSAVGSSENRTVFVKALTDLVKKYQLDGLDFDWEFPNNAGVGCNQQSPNDATNFLLLLKELRANPLGSNITLSAAVFVAPWNQTSSQVSPMTDVTGFPDVLDFIEIMNYDVYNLWAPVAGPNAPLNDTCSDNKRGSAVSAVSAWTKAGFPASKILLGVPFYARSFTVQPSAAMASDNSSLQLFPKYDVAKEQLGDANDGSGPDACGVNQPPTGVYTYQGLIDKGQLNTNGGPASGMVKKWDDCSQTPFMYNKTSSVYISYDDSQSLSKKGSFINDLSLKGFAAWDITGDHGSVLLDSILTSMRNGSTLGIAGAASSGDSSKSSSSPNSALASLLLLSGRPDASWVISMLAILMMFL